MYCYCLLKLKISYMLLFFTLFWVYYCLLNKRLNICCSPSLYFLCCISLFVYNKEQYFKISYFVDNFCFVQDKESLLRNFLHIYKCTKRFVFCFAFYFFINFTHKAKESKCSCTNRLQFFFVW